MIVDTITRSLAYQLDRFVLYTMNWRVPDSFADSYHEAPSLESVLAQTAVNRRKTAEYALSSPGEHPIWLQTMNGEMCCHVRVKPAVDPDAPLIIYHHGFGENPYYNSWQRLFRDPSPFPAHTVCIQAPFHDNWLAPFNKGFASLQNVYQMFAGSVRMMERVRSHYERQGAAFTVIAGVSWGGITSLLYEAFHHRAQAVAPMLSSPDLAQVMLDVTEMFARPLRIEAHLVRKALDFTPYYEQCETERIFPLLGENDLFFQWDHHARRFAPEPVTAVAGSHISGFWRVDPLRQHLLDTLAWAKIQPRRP